MFRNDKQAVFGEKMVFSGWISGGFGASISLGRSPLPSSVLSWVSLVSLRCLLGFGSQLTPVWSCVGVALHCIVLHPQNHHYQENPFSGCLADSHQS